MPVKIKITERGVRAVLSRFKRILFKAQSGGRSEYQEAGRQITKIYREELDNANIKRRTGRLHQGIGITELSNKSVTVGPSPDRREIALILEEGAEQHALPQAQKGHVYPMEKTVEGTVFRYTVFRTYVRPRNYMKAVMDRVATEVAPAFRRRMTIEIVKE